MAELPPDLRAPRYRTLIFRDFVIEELKDRGLVSARRPDGPAHRDAATIEGLPFYVAVHKQQSIQLNATLDAAEKAARQRLQPLFVAIHHRRGGDLAHAHVVTPLHSFARICKALAAAEDTS
jgi:hypothetical protein